MIKDLRIQFKNSDSITQNYSQAGQDLFVLSVLNGKKEGKFLDLGCHHPTEGGNNTYLLEKEFNWNGLSYDINPTPIKEFPKYRASKAVCQDCLNISWEEVISFSNHFDYLSLDLEPASITFECLKRIPLDKIEFSIITYEHDMYRFGEEYKIASHELLNSYGYIRICENIKHNGNIFEDWYINPKYVEITPQLENLKYHSNKEYSDIVFLNSDYNYTIVTGLVDNINDYRSSDTYLDLSKELLSLDVPKIIFISEKHFDFVKKYSDSRLTQIVKFEKEDIMYQFYSQFNENQNYDLPKNINFKKDTLDYFKCQNLKTLWLKEAKKLSKFNLENYMWIDFGIKHMHKNIEISSLFKKEILFKKEKIRMPRHFIAKVENEKDIIFSIDDVKWYALGSCLLINKNLIDIFHNLCQNELINIIKKSNKITWEVNIWAKLMKDFPELFDIYYVESHNENILKYMFENNDEKFDMYFSESINFFNRQNYIASNNILNQLYKYSKNKFDLERIQFLKNILNISIYKDKTSYFLKDILYYINNFSFNIDFFVKNLFDLSINLENESILKNINTIQINNFKNSNPCIFYHNNQKIINIRYVNYEFINNKQIYLNKFENKHRTLNINNNEIIFEEYNDDLKYFRENKYLGIEDIRLFKKDNKIKFIATTTQFNKNGLNQICIGDYLINGENKLIVDKVYNSPNNTNEKNWLVLDEDKLIYSYYPFTLYDFNLKKVYEYSNLPKIFQLFRGSANPIEINGLKYVLVHSTIEILNKRYYIHWILILNHKNKPIAYSLPFKFEGKEIEYCLSMNYLNNGNLEFAYSTYDNNSKILEIPLSYFNDKFLFI